MNKCFCVNFKNGDYPVVTIIGPRQSGKSTLTKMAFPDKPYVSLEKLLLRDFAHCDPVGFLDTHAREEKVTGAGLQDCVEIQFEVLIVCSI